MSPLYLKIGNYLFLKHENIHFVGISDWGKWAGLNKITSRSAVMATDQGFDNATLLISNHSWRLKFNFQKQIDFLCGC